MTQTEFENLWKYNTDVSINSGPDVGKTGTVCGSDGVDTVTVDVNEDAERKEYLYSLLDISSQT